MCCNANSRKAPDCCVEGKVINVPVTVSETPISPMVQSTTGGGPYFLCWRCQAHYQIGTVHYCSTRTGS
jgi:hypothetical protein